MPWEDNSLLLAMFSCNSARPDWYPGHGMTPSAASACRWAIAIDPMVESMLPNVSSDVCHFHCIPCAKAGTMYLQMRLCTTQSTGWQKCCWGRSNSMCCSCIVKAGLSKTPCEDMSVQQRTHSSESTLSDARDNSLPAGNQINASSNVMID